MKKAKNHQVNLWMTPLQLSILALVLFGITISIDGLSAQGVVHLPSWLTNGGIDDARDILSAEMGSVSTVLALIFSVALLVLSMVATLFGPRLLYRFIQDWVTQVTIGLFMATFIFILATFVVTRADGQDVFIPQLTLLTASLLVLISFASLVFYSHRIAISIQNPDMIARIVDDLKSTLDLQLVTRRSQPGADALRSSPINKQDSKSVLIKSKYSGFLQHVNHNALIEAVTKNSAIVEIYFRPGQFIQHGETLACVWQASSPSELEPVIIKNVQIGRHRVIGQDIEFSLCQIVEIGIRALSPALNDTFTGLACVDYLGDALRLVTEVPIHDGSWYGLDGNLRLVEPQLEFEQLVKSAFDMLRQSSSDSPAIMIRMLATIERLTPCLTSECQRHILLQQASAIWESASNNTTIIALDRADIEAAWLQTRSALVDAKSFSSAGLL